MRARPWSAYALRVLCSGLLFVTGYALLAGSTFALRMRGDLPVQTLVLALAAILAFVPLLCGRKFLGAFLVSAFLLSGIGAYWWTTIPWDEFIKDSGFPTSEKPQVLDYALVASPAILAAFYAAISRPSLLHADLKARGADPDEIRRAASISFLSGAALILVCGALAFTLWSLMAAGVVFAAVAPVPTGVPALVLVAALVTVAWALLARRLPRFRNRARSAAAQEPAREERTSAVRPALARALKAKAKSALGRG